MMLMLMVVTTMQLISVTRIKSVKVVITIIIMMTLITISKMLSIISFVSVTIMMISDMIVGNEAHADSPEQSSESINSSFTHQHDPVIIFIAPVEVCGVQAASLQQRTLQ